jgi:uncharacterized membrane protein YfbV (UPF0208 family)
MERRKLESAALFLTVAGALLFMPPLALIFQVQQRLFGVPLEVIYLFVCWALLVTGAWWLGRRLPREAEAEADEEES